MNVIDSVGRFLHYARRHGVKATLNRIQVSIKRFRAGNRQILFFCDLRNCEAAMTDGSGHGTVERKNAEAELDAPDLQRIVNSWNPKIARHQLSERFGQGASLWLFKSEGKLAGFGWTIIGRTVEPHFFPLGPNDAHLFDYFVFPEFRGRRINPALVNHVLASLASEQRSRAFIEAAEWNAPQLASLGRTPFRPFGRARKWQVTGKTLVAWGRDGLKTR
jgi:ribosomal protein S18 acetylase RimI-like enzyme